MEPNGMVLKHTGIPCGFTVKSLPLTGSPRGEVPQVTDIPGTSIRKYVEDKA